MRALSEGELEQVHGGCGYKRPVRCKPVRVCRKDSYSPCRKKVEVPMKARCIVKRTKVPVCLIKRAPKRCRRAVA